MVNNRAGDLWWLFYYRQAIKLILLEKLTNYSQRKRNLRSRIAILEDKDDEASKRELLRLEQKYTLGKVNFDSVIIIDFGNSLKSVLTSLVYTDVNQDKVLFPNLTLI